MQTKITNNTSSAMYFGFLEHHGMTIHAGHSFIMSGDLRSVIKSGRGRYSRSRELAALKKQEALGHITVTAINNEGTSSTVP